MTRHAGRPTGGFRRSWRGEHDGPWAVLAAEEVALLRSVVGDLAAMLDDDARERGTDRPAASTGVPDADALAAMVDLDGPIESPSDPALARLFPDAYRDDDSAARDFRRFTERSLYDGKRAAALAVLADLGGDRWASDPTAVRVELDDERAQQWLATLTDVRLVIASRFGVTTDADSEAMDDAVLAMPDDDPRRFTWLLHQWIGELQATLVETLM